MSELTTELDKLIQKAALDGALTQKAVDMFHSVLKENDELKDKCVKLEQTQTRMDKEALELTSKLSMAQGLNKVAAEMEASLIEREGNCLKLELSAKYQEMRVEDHKEMFTTVFRNSVLRKEVMTPNESHTEVTGASHSSFSSKDTVEEEET